MTTYLNVVFFGSRFALCSGQSWSSPESIAPGYFTNAGSKRNMQSCSDVLNGKLSSKNSNKKSPRPKTLGFCITAVYYLHTNRIRHTTKVFDLVKVHVAINIIGFGIKRLHLFEVLCHGGDSAEEGSNRSEFCRSKINTRIDS